MLIIGIFCSFFFLDQLNWELSILLLRERIFCSADFSIACQLFILFIHMHSFCNYFPFLTLALIYSFSRFLGLKL